MHRLFHTSIFRIALLYLLLLGATLLALLAVIYWSTANLIERQSDETVQAEIRGLAEQYSTEGLPRLVEVIRERSGPGGAQESVYLLTGPDLHPLAGNLTAWPGDAVDEDGWLEVSLGRGDDPSGARHSVRGQAFDLAGGYRLFVGRDRVERDDFRDIVARALAWALLPALLLGLAGGALIGRYSLSRVDAVRAAGADIVRGDLSRRVPLTGSGDEFDRLAATINEMLARIETLMGGMRLVTDSLAHDLRSPLTRAKSAIEMALRHGREAEAYREALEQTAAELEIILRTFEALINIAQAEAQLNLTSMKELDLSALAGDLLELYQPIAEEAGLELYGDIAEGLAVHGHRQLLGQAIANLLDNAIKYSRQAGQGDQSRKILLSLAHHGGAVVLSVADGGPGIPPQDRARVLDRFVRLDDSRGTPGSGLGLSLVTAVAKLHGARLDLGDNNPGLKVTLTFAKDRPVQ